MSGTENIKHFGPMSHKPKVIGYVSEPDHTALKAYLREQASTINNRSFPNDYDHPRKEAIVPNHEHIQQHVDNGGEYPEELLASLNYDETPIDKRIIHDKTYNDYQEVPNSSIAKTHKDTPASHRQRRVISYSARVEHSPQKHTNPIDRLRTSFANIFNRITKPF